MNPLLETLSQLLTDYPWPSEWLYSPVDTIRSHVPSEPGHYFSGLKNLGATCYINSIIQQFFMIVPFRRSILAVPSDLVAQSSSAYRKLFLEFQALLLTLQETQRRFVDPSQFALSYDTESFSAHVQMDVDEFFNLLFDRLENALAPLGAEHANLFKEFFGGTLSQQVVSKQCAHVSTRDESFFALQCEVKGFESLHESLKRYVLGEDLDGDNQYFCSTCNAKVDAIKRTCLKSLPRHLLFHLKRFDFDFETMKRLKVDNRFSFPELIDMYPFTAQFFASDGGSKPMDEDSPPVFMEQGPTVEVLKSIKYELAGVLVHMGTADSGHYYSYIKDRQDKTKWFHFNDSQVVPFDVGELGNATYGGPDQNSSRTQHNRNYSAYMLVYDRVETENPFIVMQQQQDGYEAGLMKKILDDNKRLDQDRFFFAEKFNVIVQNSLDLSLLPRLPPPVTSSLCASYVAPTPDWLQYTKVGALYFFKVLIHGKDLTQARFWTSCVVHYMQDADSCLWVLNLIIDETLLVKLLLECPLYEVRGYVYAVLIAALTNLKNLQPSVYEQEVLPKLANIIMDCLPQLIGHYKTFNSFLFFLAQLCGFGAVESRLFLSKGAVEQLLILVLKDYPVPSRHRFDRSFRVDLDPCFLALTNLFRHVNLLNSVSNPENSTDMEEDQDTVATLRTRDLELLFQKDPKTEQYGFFRKLFDVENISLVQEFLTVLFRPILETAPSDENLQFYHWMLDVLFSNIAMGKVGATACFPILVASANKDEKIALSIYQSLLTNLNAKSSNEQVLLSGLACLMECVRNYKVVGSNWQTDYQDWIPDFLFCQYQVVRESASLLVCEFFRPEAAEEMTAISDWLFGMVDRARTVYQANKRTEGTEEQGFILAEYFSLIRKLLDFEQLTGKGCVNLLLFAKAFCEIHSEHKALDMNLFHLADILLLLATRNPAVIQVLGKISAFVKALLEYYRMKDKSEECIRYNNECLAPYYKLVLMMAQSNPSFTHDLTVAHSFIWSCEQIGLDDTFFKGCGPIFEVVRHCAEHNSVFRKRFLAMICVKCSASELSPILLIRALEAVNLQEKDIAILNESVLSKIVECLTESQGRPESFEVLSHLQLVSRFYCHTLNTKSKQLIEKWLVVPNGWTTPAKSILSVVVSCLNFFHDAQTRASACEILGNFSQHQFFLEKMPNLLSSSLYEHLQDRASNPADHVDSKAFGPFSPYMEAAVASPLSHEIEKPQTLDEPAIHFNPVLYDKVPQASSEIFKARFHTFYDMVLQYVRNLTAVGNVLAALTLCLLCANEAVLLDYQPIFSQLLWIVSAYQDFTSEDQSTISCVLKVCALIVGVYRSKLIERDELVVILYAIAKFHNSVKLTVALAKSKQFERLGQDLNGFLESRILLLETLLQKSTPFEPQDERQIRAVLQHLAAVFQGNQAIAAQYSSKVELLLSLHVETSPELAGLDLVSYNDFCSAKVMSLLELQQAPLTPPRRSSMSLRASSGSLGTRDEKRGRDEDDVDSMDSLQNSYSATKLKQDVFEDAIEGGYISDCSKSTKSL